MNIIAYPSEERWATLVQRPTALVTDQVRISVHQILSEVRTDGDAALKKLTAKFDQAEIQDLKMPVSGTYEQLDTELKTAIRSAFDNIRSFHLKQVLKTEKIETTPGVMCWRESRPIDPVGLYIPGGTAPLFSSLLMLGVPAIIAGCKEIVICTPPQSDGSVNPAILYTASLLGISEIYTVGGAQAIGAMAYGTETIPKVHKIFGPGNAYVTAAKQAVQAEGTAIDMPAGPSEVLVIADDSCDPKFVAADLLSQAEHGPDSQVVLVSTDKETVEQVLSQVERQLEGLPRKDVARSALENSFAVVVQSLDEACAFSNAYAPEHLIINTKEPEQLTQLISSAGSVFIGPWSCESMGDYASGTNHTLPTAGFASSYSGVSVDSFVKKITFQRIEREGIRNLGPVVETMARAEGLAAHERAVSVRLNAIDHE